VNEDVKGAEMHIGALIVDDQEDVRLLIRLIIDAANKGLFVACEARSGQEALDRLDGCDPEIVVLDAMMPGIDGLETAMRIRERRPGQPMILCSAYLDEPLRQKAEEAGIKVCLGKAEFQRIPEAIHEVVGAAGDV
jgi:two-component system, chemotaxis family, chemotaxis protein CheY